MERFAAEILVSAPASTLLSIAFVDELAHEVGALALLNCLPRTIPFDALLTSLAWNAHEFDRPTILVIAADFRQMFPAAEDLNAIERAAFDMSLNSEVAAVIVLGRFDGPNDIVEKALACLGAKLLVMDIRHPDAEAVLARVAK